MPGNEPKIEFTNNVPAINLPELKSIVQKVKHESKQTGANLTKARQHGEACSVKKRLVG